MLRSLHGLGGVRRAGLSSVTYDYEVSNTTELNAAITAAVAASGSRTIGLNGGTYADLSRVGSTFAKTNGVVRLLAKSRTSLPLFRSMNLNGCSGFELDGLRFESISVDSFGFPNTLGLAATDAADFKVRNCVFQGFQWQINATRARNATIEFNRFGGYAVDSIRVYEGIEDVLIQNNDWQLPNIDTQIIAGAGRNNQSDRHPDCVQWACNAGQSQPRRLRIRWNRAITQNTYHQVFFGGNARVKNGDSRLTYGFLNFEIYGNFIEGSHTNTICSANAVNMLIRGNVIRRRSGGNWDWQSPQRATIDQPAISVIGVNSGTITNNVMFRSIAEIEGGNVANFSVSNNPINSTALPTEDGYWIGMPQVGPWAYE